MKIWIVLALLALPASAEQVCSSVYNPMTGRWEYQCVEGHVPVCRQVYDAMNGVWVTVCD